jgi:hypothetical protein
MSIKMIENNLDWARECDRNRLLEVLRRNQGSKTPYEDSARDLSCSVYHVERGLKKLRRLGIERPLLYPNRPCEEVHRDEDKPKRTMLDMLIREAQGRRLGREYPYVVAIADLLKPFVQVIDHTPPPLVIPPAKPIYDEEDVVVVIGDAHVGSLIRKEEIGGLGEYNKDIFVEEIKNLEDDVVRICEIEGRNRPIGNLCLMYLGDIVEGHDIFNGQPYHLDMNAAESVVFAADAFSRLEISLRNRVNAKRIRTVEVVGNHGVPGGRKGGALPTKLSWDWLFYIMKDKIMKNYVDDGTIHHLIAETWFQLVDVKGHLFLLLHGDDIPNYLSIPYYGIDRAAMSYMQMLEVPYHSMIVGHFHASATTPLTSGEKIINGCWPGVSMYAAKKIRARSFPEQWIFGVHPRRGITFRYKLQLRSPEAINKLKPSIVKMPI